jgi:hypothetical protein
MEYHKELAILEEFAGNIMRNNDIAQKATGLNNLLNRIKNTISHVINEYAEVMNHNTDWRFNCYLQEVKFGFRNTPHNNIINLVNEHIADIETFEKDTQEQYKERQNKLKKYE